MMEKVRVMLRKSFFTEKEKTLLKSGAFSVSTFLYPTGVAAMRVKNEKGELIWLPFKGQQIWRATFGGRDLTMVSTFPEPVDTPDFHSSYGGFLLHCGMTSMGNPTPEDTHPQHGELPSVAYDSAFVVLGEDEGGIYIELGGEVRYRQCFAVDYTAKPMIKLYEKETLMALSLLVENHRVDPMDYLYLCHVNYRPIEGARLVYSVSRKEDSIKVHKDVPESLPPDRKAKLSEYLDKLEADPSIMDIIDSTTQIYEPEIVFSVFYESDREGWARCLQVAPDGSADYLAFKPSELPYGIRWIARTGNEDAIGICLPSTAEHKGMKYCREREQIKTLPPNSCVEFNVIAGWLDPDKAAEEARKC